MNIVIQTPLKPGYSETFLRSHIDFLPYNCFNIYSLPKRGYFPLYDGYDQELFSTNIIINYAEALIDRVSNEGGIGYILRHKQLKNFLLKEDIKLVLAEYGPTGTYLLDICKDLHIPIVPYFHGRDSYHYKTLKRFKDKYISLFEYAPIIFCVSNAMKDQLISIGAPPDKLVVNPCSPNNKIFYNQELDRTPHSMIAVGRFCGKKAPLNTIMAVEKVIEKFPNATLSMIGDGPLFAECADYIKEHKLHDNIFLLGRMDSIEIAKLMNQSSLFLQHSIRAADGDSEGTPVSILEAMACGCPVVSTLHAGIPDVVSQGVHGYLVEEGDVQGMSDKILELLDSKNLAEMRTQCINSVLENHTLAEHLKVIETELNKFL